MKKSSTLVAAIVVVIILAGAGYAIFHKSNKTTPAASTQTTSKSTTPAVNNAVLLTKTDPSLGQYLADPSGMPLYTYSADTNGVSNCTGTCLKDWPAYVDTGSAANLPTGVSTIKRTDNGQIQYTYNGLPLYTFIQDSAGKVTGNGEDNFKIATPSTNTTSSSSSSSTTPSSGSSSSNNSSSSSSGYNY